jgi:putative peptidoglycan lipid II flippase
VTAPGDGSTPPPDPALPEDAELPPVRADQPTATGVADEPQSRHTGLLRRSAVMAVGTVFSRASGSVRSLLLTAAIGTGVFSGSFQLANVIPTSVYFLIAGGAINTIFVPQLVRAMKRDEDGGDAFGQRLLTLTVVILLLMTVAAVFAAPLLIRIWASNDLLRPENRPYYDLAVALARWCLPQIFFYGLYTILGQILNARGRFGPMMWAPLLNNIISMVVFAAFMVVGHGPFVDKVTGSDITLLGLGSTIGIAAQALCLIPLLKGVGFPLLLRFDLRGKGLTKSARMAGWSLGFVLVNQLWFVLVTRITTGAQAQATSQGLTEGIGITPYMSAFLIFQVPHSIVTVSLVTALLPALSTLAAEGRMREVAVDLAQALRTTVVTLAPAAAVYFALGPLLTQAVFANGNTTTADARYIGLVLAAQAPALLFFSSHYVTLRAFYSVEDTRTPVFVQLVIVAVSGAFAFFFYETLPLFWKTLGVGIAFSIGYLAGFALNLLILRRRLVGGLAMRSLAWHYLRTAFAAAAAGAVGWLTAWLLRPVLPPGRLSVLVMGLVGSAVVGVVYIGLAKLLRLREIDQMLAMITRRLRRAPG